MESRSKAHVSWCILLEITVAVLFCSNAQAAPLKITLDTYRNCIDGSILSFSVSCCPGVELDLNVTVVDFIPKRDRLSGHRIRKALQCLTGEELRTYTEKLTRAYELMRALPSSDPRSLHQQELTHCAHGTGSFVQDGLKADSNFTLDIHSSWIFLPWHRMFIYFHERILQKLLDDPTFTLHFWNFDNGLDGRTSSTEGCSEPGHFFPGIYNDNSTSTFEPSRSNRTRVLNVPIDLTFPVMFSEADPAVALRCVNEAVPRNREAMHLAMQKGRVSRDFFGIPFRYGDVRPPMLVGGGSLEYFPHNSLHDWVGGFMRTPLRATGDPVFYPAHANVDRLWDVWMKLGDGRELLQPTDPDWLDAEFLLWDENRVLRRLKVKDVLNIADLGYSYEKVYDASWIFWQNSTGLVSSAMAPTQP
ncbi:hypothetical protein R1sor_014902 [Riccia sorocarpa]|uniref:Tyrosinase copper-binding domain-containing protein n=1 Tax=Riccia sorocarpa TaxID=122646 RepID=A0ABD3HAP7_9MARC